MNTLIEGRDCEVQGSYLGATGFGRINGKVMYTGLEDIDGESWYVFSHAFLGRDGKPGFQRFRTLANESNMPFDDYLYTSAYVEINNIEPEIEHTPLVIDFLKRTKKLYDKRTDIPENHLLVQRLEELLNSKLVLSNK